jgi:hypothetical protein
MKKNIPQLMAAVFVISAYPALYLMRHLDDNRLTSWEWVFGQSRAPAVFAVLVGGVILAFFFLRTGAIPRRPVFFLLCATFATGALFWGEPEVIVDSSRYFTAAKHLEVYGAGYFLREWGRSIGAWTDMPLVPFLYGVIFRFFGEERIFIQIFNTVLFSLSSLLTYLIGKELWDEKTGFYGGLFLLGMPYLLTQVPLMLVDVPTMFFFLLSMYTFIYALRNGRGTVVCPVLAIPLAVYSKYSSVLMLSVLAIIFLVFIAEEKNASGRRSVLWRALGVVFMSGLLAGAVFLYKADVFLAQARLLMEFQRPGLARWSESFVSTFLFQVSPVLSLAAVFSVLAAIKQRDKKYCIIAWLVLLVIILGIRRIRYIIMVFPMLGLMASYGILRIRDGKVRSFIAACALLFSLSVAFCAYLPFLNDVSTVNLKEAGKFLDSLPGSSVRVYTLLPDSPIVNPAVAVPILDLFTAKKILYDYDMDISVVPRREREDSSLRFTWEYNNPGYYMSDSYSGNVDAIAVISKTPDDILPAKIAEKIRGCHPAKAFDVYEGLFQFRTNVRVYSCEVFNR